MKLKSQWKYVLLFLIPLLILVFYINNVFVQLKHYNVEMQLDKDEAVVSKIQAQTLEHFYQSEQDVIFIAAYVGKNLDNVDQSHTVTQNIKSLLDSLMPNFPDVNNIHKEISFIDKEGKEVIIASGHNVQEVPPQNRLDQDYLQGSLRKRVGEVYVSFEGPMIYLTSPIFSEKQGYFGTLVLTLQKDELLKDLQADTRDNVMLIEDTGKYILSPNAQRGEDFSADFSPEVLATIRASQFGHLEIGQNTLLTYASLKLDDHRWHIIKQDDKMLITAQTTSLLRGLIGIVALTFACVLGLLVLWIVFYHKTVRTEQLSRENSVLESLNSELIDKQLILEEQATLVEELNAQLADESTQYRQQKDTLQAIIDSVEVGIVMTNTAQKTIFMNKAWHETFQSTQVGLDGRMLVQNALEGTKDFAKNILKFTQLLDDYEESAVVELEQHAVLHQIIHFRTLPCRSSDGHALGRIFLYRDITQYREVDRLKSELISTVSHELRTPMSSIMGFAELLLTRKLSPDRSKQYIEIIHTQAERLTKLISDFLDIQRIESGKHEFIKQRISFVEVVNNTLNLFRDTDQKHQFSFDNDLTKSLDVECDTDKLIQVMSNLLSNAIKYSPQGGKINIKVESEGGFLKVSISDHGLGIPQDAQAKLFSKFFRVDNDDRREIGGTGLGLAICKEIILAHGGKIWAESTYEQGSTFYFTLPLAEPIPFSKDLKMGRVSVEDGKINPEILIVEDDESLVDLMEVVLKEDGFSTFAVNNADAALSLVKEKQFKMIILDINLAGTLNGWDVVKALKQDKNTSNIPVIISSVFENRGKPQSKDINEYLVKPFKLEELLTVVHKVMLGNVESTMLMQGDEALDEYVVEILRQHGIKVREFKRAERILIITLDGEIINEL